MTNVTNACSVQQRVINYDCIEVDRSMSVNIICVDKLTRQKRNTFQH